MKKPAQQTDSSADHGRRGREQSGRRRWFRIAAVLLGFLPLIILEVACRLGSRDVAPAAIDPYVDLHALELLFELDSATQTYAIGEKRLHLFQPASFSLEKTPSSFRVFALGGSTTQGEPYSTETAFPKWLEIRLQAMMPSRDVEVINCGGLSYASYRVAAICREILTYQPDLIVVYTGHNEYLEKRSYASQAASGLLSAFARTCTENLKSVQLIQRVVRGPASRDDAPVPTKMSTEVDALLDYQGGLEDYRRGDSWITGVVDHYRWNVSRIVDSCQAAGVPVAFVVPTSNVLDCPPMKFETAPDLSPDRLEQFNQTWELAKSQSASGDRAKAIDSLHAAIEIDPLHAGSLFLLGRLYFELGDYGKAKEYLTAARDADVCPLRATTKIVSSLRSTLRDSHTTIVDAEEFFEEQSPNGLVGDKWLVDHIHPSVAGHQRLGDLIADTLMEEGLIAAEIAQAQWKAQQESLVGQHLASLGEEYYHRGKQRLEGLQLWTQGRAKKVRSELKVAE